MGKKRWHRERQKDREALWPLSAQERYISIDVEMVGPVQRRRQRVGQRGMRKAEMMSSPATTTTATPGSRPRSHAGTGSRQCIGRIRGAGICATATATVMGSCASDGIMLAGA